LLRLWMVGFCLYGIVLSNAAGGFRKVWQFAYGIMAIPFILIWGLSVEQWAIIDWIWAGLISLSAFFLRTEPADA